MAYKLHLWEVRDNRTGRVTAQIRARSLSTLKRRLGRQRASEVSIRQLDR